MKKRHILIFAISILLISFQLKANTFSFRHYKVEDGLTFNTVRSIIQDRRGFMWIGTEDGLNRFDGYTFKEFRSKANSKNSIGSNYVGTLLEDSNGDIWIGTENGVYIYHPTTEKFIRLEAKTNKGVICSSSVNNIVEDKLKNIWLSTYGQGIFCYNLNSGKLEQYNIVNEGSAKSNYNFINYIYVDHNNLVWAAPKTPSSPLIFFNRPKKQFQIVPLKLNSTKKNTFSVYKIFEDSQHNFWLGTWDKGLCKLDIKSKKVTSYLSPQSAGGIIHIHEINEYKPNLLLIGSDDGLSLFNTKTLQHQLLTSSETDPSSISDNFVYPIFKDREGGIWIGTYFGGVNYVSPNNGLFERYTHSKYVNSVNGNVISRFTEDKNGNIWIASDDGGLNVFNTQTGHFSAYMPQKGKNSISYHNVHALCWDNDKLWIGTYSGGLNVLDTKTGIFKYYNSEETNPKTLDGGSIYAIYKDREKRMWVASMSGVNLYNRKTDNFTRVKHFNATTIDITQDNKGLLWFATQGKGLFRLNPKTNQWRNYSTLTEQGISVPCSQMNCLRVDHKGQLWLGTSCGLCKYDYAKDIFTIIPLNIPSNTICCIIEDNNNLWLTTSKGLVRYNTIGGAYQVFTQSDGLLSDLFMFNSGFKSSKGKIYIGTANGFNAFCPKKVVANKCLPPVAITNLEIYNKDVEIQEDGPLTKAISSMDQIDLSYKDNVFSLSYVALSYSTPEKNMYAYKLEGFDKEWNHVNRQHKATYTNLPAGEYIFRVRASNNDGLWNNEGTSVKIVIHPPLWLTIGFKILYIILIAGGIVFLLRSINQRSERKHKEKIKELNQEKEKELYDAKISFFTMIAHEIRTPVSLIIGPLEKIMNAGFNIPEKISNDLNIIERNSQRLLLLVNQLLDFRKAEQGSLTISFTKQNVHDLLLYTFDRFKPMLEQKGVEFIFNCPDKKLEADIDQEALTKIVSNLLTNAMKFTESRIELSCVSYPDTNTFRIKVSDNGPGISDQEKEKIFLPFYQISSNTKPGTGIGLSLVKTLVDAHNGTISVEDAEDKGVSFVVNLPIKNALSGENNNSSAKPVSMPDLKSTINSSEQNIEIAPVINKEKPLLLIVEDNADMRNFLQESFSADYQIITAEDGIDGLEKLKTCEASLIISDLMMPRMDGLEFCSALRNKILLSHIPVVLLTAKTDLSTKIEGMNCGADAYIEKPFSIHFLKAQIKNLIESRKKLRQKFSELPFVPLKSIAGNNADEEFLTRMNTIIEKNISNVDFSIDSLAEQLCISRSGLFAKIKTLAEITPNELIQVVRLKKAAELLTENKYRINEIAYMVGFNNPSYFSKCFQKQFGIRPGDFINKKEN